MRLLLDTHALLWWLFDDPKLPSTPRGLMADPDNAILVSSASAWEICTKHRLGKLPAATELARDVEEWLCWKNSRSSAATRPWKALVYG